MEAGVAHWILRLYWRCLIAWSAKSYLLLVDISMKPILCQIEERDRMGIADSVGMTVYWNFLVADGNALVMTVG